MVNSFEGWHSAGIGWMTKMYNLKMLKNTALAAKIGVDTVENRSQKDPDKCTTSRFSLVFVRDVTPYCTLCGLGTLIVHTFQCNLAPL